MCCYFFGSSLLACFQNNSTSDKNKSKEFSVEVEFGSKTHTYQKAFGYNLGGKGLNVTFTTDSNLNCDSFDELTIIGGATLTMWLIPMLNTDGTSVWKAKEVRFNVRAFEQEEYDIKEIVVSEESIFLQLDISSNIKAFLKGTEMEKKEEKVKIKGKMEIKNCGYRTQGSKSKEKRQNRVQTALNVSLAGEEIDIKGAVIKGSGFIKDLYLSSNPIDCTSNLMRESDLVMEIPLFREEIQRTNLPELYGQRIRTQFGLESKEIGGFVIPTLPKEDLITKTYSFPVDDSFNIEGYALKISGMVDAQACSK